MFQKYFYHVVAVIVLVLGLYSIESGLVLTGSPVSANRVMRAIRGEPAAAAAPDPATFERVALPPAAVPPGESSAAQGSFQAQLNVENYGYSPEVLTLPANQPIQLHLVTKDTRSCSRAFVIPDLDVEELLPETGDVVVDLPAQSAGTNIDFMCSMGLYTGVFQFR
jgi:heme/copper-type cytochrome/quinol oxidase subunit 2